SLFDSGDSLWRPAEWTLNGHYEITEVWFSRYNMHKTGDVDSSPPEDCGGAAGTLGEAEEGRIGLVFRAKRKESGKYSRSLLFGSTRRGDHTNLECSRRCCGYLARCQSP